MDLHVVLVGHHVDERSWRRVLHHENRVPAGLFTVADHLRRRVASVADGAADPLQVRHDLLRVANVAFAAAVEAELQQVDHHDGLVGRSGGECGHLFARRLKAAHRLIVAAIAPFRGVTRSTSIGSPRRTTPGLTMSAYQPAQADWPKNGRSLSPSRAIAFRIAASFGRPG